MYVSTWSDYSTCTPASKVVILFYRRAGGAFRKHSVPSATEMERLCSQVGDLRYDVWDGGLDSPRGDAAVCRLQDVSPLSASLH